MNDEKELARERVRAMAAEHAERGDALGWFDALYREAAGDNSLIPWADLEPNRFFREWAESRELRGDGRRALVVGCGLGDDARYLDELGFSVTAFDISPAAIEWARRLHGETSIVFEVMDLFEPFRGWLYRGPATTPSPVKHTGSTPPKQGGEPENKNGGFDLVLEIYTIQPLPLEMRASAIDAIASFVGAGGTLVVVTRGREDGEDPGEMPWPVSRAELAGFEAAGLSQVSFEIMPGEEDEPARFIVEYRREVTSDE